MYCQQIANSQKYINQNKELKKGVLKEFYK